MTPHYRAAVWMLGSVGCFCAMAVAGRQLAPLHDPFEVLLYRNIIGVVLILGWALATRTTGRIRRGPLRLHGLRNLFSFGAQAAWFHAVGVLPLAQVFALEFTTPLWVLLLAAPLLGERITRTGALCAALGFAGVLIVARPGTDLDPDLIAAAACAVGFALGAIYTRQLTRTENLMSILLWMNIMQLALSLLAAGVDGAIALPSAQSLIPLMTVGVAGLFAHLCLTSALALAPAADVMPFDFLRLPVIAALGYVLFDEPMTWGLVVGSLMILAANWINLARR